MVQTRAKTYERKTQKQSFCTVEKFEACSTGRGVIFLQPPKIEAD